MTIELFSEIGEFSGISFQGRDISTQVMIDVIHDVRARPGQPQQELQVGDLLIKLVLLQQKKSLKFYELTLRQLLELRMHF